jgi:hypothetical protein
MIKFYSNENFPMDIVMDRSSQSPQLVVGRWCGAKYGLAIALWQ